MNWKNSICLNLTLAKGLSTLPPWPFSLALPSGSVQNPKSKIIEAQQRKASAEINSKKSSKAYVFWKDNDVLFEEKPMFFNQCFDKGRLKNFVLWFLLNYGESKTVQLVEQLKNVGFQYASKAGISLGIDDLKIPPKKNDLIYEAEKLTQVAVQKYASGEITGVERFQSLIDIWHRTSEFLKQEVINHFEATDILNPVYMMAFSGARGNISQVRQLVGMRGLMADPQGQIIDFPIRSNFREGLTLTEYIISSYGARKGIVDTALRTANAGYLTRRLVDVAQHVIISNFDCGTRRGIFLTNMKEGNKTIHSVSQRIVGRILARDLFKDSDSPNPIKIASRNDEVTLDLAFEIGQNFSKVFVRSALTCETSKQICQLCYGWSLAQGNLVSIGEAVGVVAAQSIGEPGTQLTMRTFHTGGVFSGDVSDQIKAPFDGIVEYEAAIPGTLIRTPEGRIAFLTKAEGYFYVHKPINNLDSNFFSVFTNKSDKKLKESLFSESKKFKIPYLTLLYIKNGQQVYAKDVIAQISTISRQTNASAGLAEEVEFTIKSECEGQFYSKSLVLNEKEIGPSLTSPLTEGEEEDKTTKDFITGSIAIDKIYQSWTWGYAWILSGKIYEFKIPSLFFPKLGDFMNSKSYLSQIEWKLNPINGHSVFYDIHKRTPGNILNKKKYMPSSLLDKSGDSFFTAKNSQIGLGSKESFNETLTTNPINFNFPKKEDFDEVSPMQSSQILFFDLTKILYKKYGYVLQLPEKPQFFKKSKLPSLLGAKHRSDANRDAAAAIYKSSFTLQSNKQPKKDLLFFLKSLTMLNTSNTRTELPYFLEWFPSKNQTLTGGCVLLDMNSTMDSNIFMSYPANTPFGIVEKSATKEYFLSKLNTSFFNHYTLKAKKINQTFYTRITASPITTVVPLEYPNELLRFKNRRFLILHQRCKQALGAKAQTNGNISLKLLYTLIQTNINKIKMNKSLSLTTTHTPLRKGAEKVNKSKAHLWFDTSDSLEGQGKDVKKIEALDSRVLWMSSSFFKIKLSSLTNSKTALLFNTSKESPLFYLKQPFQKEQFRNEQSALLTPLPSAEEQSTSLTSEPEVTTQTNEEVQETKDTNLELSQKQSSNKKLNFSFFNKNITIFLQTNRQGNIKGFQQSNLGTVKNPLETKGALLKLKVSNYLTSNSSQSTTTSLTDVFNKSKSAIFERSSSKKQSFFDKEANQKASANDKKRKLSCFKQYQFANLTTYCRFANTSLSSLPSLVKHQKHELKTTKINNLYFGTFGTFTTLIDNSFNDSLLLRSISLSSKGKEVKTTKVIKNLRFLKEKEILNSRSKRNRSLFFNYFVYTKGSNFFVSNYFEKEYKRYNKIQNKANFYSFMSEPLPAPIPQKPSVFENERAKGMHNAQLKRVQNSLFQLTPCLQIHNITDNPIRHLQVDKFNTLPTNSEKDKIIEAQSLSKKTGLRREPKVVKKKGKISKNLVFHGALKKGWVVVPASFNSLQLWKFHKRRINPGQGFMDKIRFNSPILTECFLFNDIFNIETTSLPNSLSFGKSGLLNNTKVQHFALQKPMSFEPKEVQAFPKSIEANGDSAACKIQDTLQNKPSVFEAAALSKMRSSKIFDTLQNQTTFDFDKTTFFEGKQPKGFLKSEENVNGLSWVKNKKSRYFMSSSSTVRTNTVSNKLLIESNSLTQNNVKIGLFIQPIEEYTKMSNIEFKNYVYESNSSTLNNLCKKIDSSALCLTISKRSLEKGSPKEIQAPISGNSKAKKSDIFKRINKRRFVKPFGSPLEIQSKQIIKSKVNQSFDSLLNWQKYKSDLYNKQKRTLQPLAKFTQKDFSVFSVAPWSSKSSVLNKRTNLLFENSLTTLGNINKASSNTTKKQQSSGTRSRLKSNFKKQGNNVSRNTPKLSKNNFVFSLFHQKVIKTSRKPLNLSPFLINFDNFSYVPSENRRLSNFSEETTNQKASLFKPLLALPAYQKVNFKEISKNPIIKESTKSSYVGYIKDIHELHQRCKKRKPSVLAPSVLSKTPKGFLKKHSRANLQKLNSAKNANLKVAPLRLSKAAQQREGTGTKQNQNNLNKGYFNLSLSYQTYMISYPPISQFDSLLDPSLNQNLNLILDFYLNKTLIQQTSKPSHNALLASLSANPKGGASLGSPKEIQMASKNQRLFDITFDFKNRMFLTAANRFYFNLNSLIQNVFESPCFSYNLTYPINKFALYKKAKMSGPSVSLRTKMQSTQFFYSFPNNSFSGKREEIQSNKPFAQTNYASPFIGEVVYTNKNLLNYPSALTYQNPEGVLKRREASANPKPEGLLARPSGSVLSKTPSVFLKAHKVQKPKASSLQQYPIVENIKNLDNLSSEKLPMPPLSYSCMFLTQKDLISFYLPSNNVKQSLNINYGKNYQINEILVKFLNMAENSDSENIIKQLESFVRITAKDQTVATVLNKKTKTKENFELQVSKLEAGFPLFAASSFSKTQSIDKGLNKVSVSKNMSLLGDFIMYGDPINNTGLDFAKGEDLGPSLSTLCSVAFKNRRFLKSAETASEKNLAAICANGQIIHYNNQKITLRRGQPIFISPKAVLHKNDGEFIDPKTPVITLSYQRLKTGDIIQGIPKVEQFFEARTTKRGRLFRDSLPSLLKALFNRYQSKLPLELAVRQSFYKIQQIIVDGVQRVYKSQGVTIADKHLEVIVKQMTSKVRIIDGAQTGFFPGEIVDLNFVEKINTFLIQKITYEPLVLGITRASLEVDSFLSASSFQQTTRILSQAAIYRKKDFLKGLKENVILGNLIPSGTGYLVNQDDIYSKI